MMDDGDLCGWQSSLWLTSTDDPDDHGESDFCEDI